MNISCKHLPFALDRHKYSLSLSSVEKVHRTVEITPLPKAPLIVLGVINVRGRITPVVDTRKRFGLPEREIGLNDQLIIAQTPKLHVVLVVPSKVFNVFPRNPGSKGVSPV